MSEKLTPPTTVATAELGTPVKPSAIYYKPVSVSQITFDVKASLENKFSHVIVEGELSNYKKHSSGHSYFSLIEGDSLLQCVCWKSVKIPELMDGMKIVCTGKITAYTGRSQFQLVVQSINIAGQGNLYKLFEELKQKLQKEGLFDESRKKPLPAFPKTVGIIVGTNSDAMHDILKRMQERFLYKTIINNVLVQGPQAPAEIIEAIKYFHQLEQRPDILIISRGGGSIEDLAAFNDEGVVRTVAAAEIPIVTAVGHEMDVTLVDYVSDKRAPTPTASVEMTLPKVSDLLDFIQQATSRLETFKDQKITHATETIQNIKKLKSSLLESFYSNKQQKLDSIKDKIELLIKNKFESMKQNIPQKPSLAGLYDLHKTKLDNIKNNINIAKAIETKQNQLEQYKALLEGFAYTNVLQRGFCLAMDENCNPITTAEKAKKEKTLKLEFQDGIIKTIIS